MATRDTTSAVAVEALFFGQNVRTAFAVGQARGVVLLSAGLAGLPCYSYTPQAVKQAVDSGVDGIISVGANPNLMGEGMTAVAAKDVPFVITSQSPQKGDLPGVDSWIRPDAVKGGSDIGKWIAGDSDGAGSVLIIDTPEYADSMMRNDSVANTLQRQCSGQAARARADDHDAGMHGFRRRRSPLFD